MRRVAAMTIVLAAALAALAATARASTAPFVQWCGTSLSTTDRPDTVAGRQVHAIYAYPSDGTDRFATLGSAISTDLGAVDTWWRGQDFTRTPRFDFADIGCPGSFGALDISDVKLPHDSAYYYDVATRLDRIDADLVAAGFDNAYKKYLVYYDTPQALPADLCGQGMLDPQNGGARGYAGIWLAPDLVSGPTTSGCGDLDDPADLGGYTAIVAAHEMLHTFGALDTWDTPGPPNAYPGSPAHACDNPLDIMQPGGHTYWLDNTLLDFNHDDYYGHSGAWWDVQDSPWLRHPNAPPHTFTVQLGAGVASVASDVPGIACAPGQACVSTWDEGSAFELAATPAPGYSRPVWTGACAQTGGSLCDVTLNTDTTTAVSFAKALTVGKAHATFLRHPARVRATATLSRTPLPGEVAVDCSTVAGLKLVSHKVAGSAVTCLWSVPHRLAGKQVRGSIVVIVDDNAQLDRSFALRLPKTL